VFRVNDKPLIVRRNADLLRSELAHVKAETKHLAYAGGAIARTVVKHVAEIHLFQEVFSAAAAMAVIRRLQPEEVVAQARHLSTISGHRHRVSSSLQFALEKLQSIEDRGQTDRVDLYP